METIISITLIVGFYTLLMWAFKLMSMLYRTATEAPEKESDVVELPTYPEVFRFEKKWEQLDVPAFIRRGISLSELGGK